MPSKSRTNLHKIIKKGETRFGKQIQKLYDERLAELKAKLERLQTRQKEGWGYRKVWRKRHRVPAHSVTGHWAWLPVKRR